MKSALLTRAALCICPPAVVATTAATLPPVRKAVHHLTAPATPARPVARQAPPCVPVTSKTFASSLPSFPTETDVPPIAMTAVTPGPGGNTPIGAVVPNTPAIPQGPGTLPPNSPTTPDTPAVPEPSAWAMMVVGFGLVGAGYRQRRRQVARGRALALAGGASGLGMGDAVKGVGAMLGGGAATAAAFLTGATTPVQASTRLGQMGSKALSSSMLAKAALCVCPPVAMAVTTAAVPPVRHAVYNATAPSTPKPLLNGVVASTPVPCMPVDVPTAAESVKTGGDELAVFKPTPSWPG